MPDPNLSIWRMPADISADGWRIDWLIHITLVFVTILFLVMVAWMTLACLRHGAAHAAYFTRGDEKRWTLAKLAIAAAIFLGVDGNLFVNSTIDLEEVLWNFEAPEKHPNVVRIEVNARQWAWEARYAGADGLFATPDDIVTLNDIRVPIDAPVLMQLGSIDVIHSLYLPNLRVKQDVVPGSITRATFTPKALGTFDVGCAQHCGTHHYKMRASLTVMTPEAFAAWQREAAALSAADYDPENPSAEWGWKWRSHGT